jgi:threonine aldolase
MRKFMAEAEVGDEQQKEDPSVKTNPIFFDVSGMGVTAEAFDALLRKKGLRISVLGRTRVRAVTPLDVSREQVKEAIQILQQVAEQIAKRKTWP